MHVRKEIVIETKVIYKLRLYPFKKLNHRKTNISSDLIKISEKIDSIPICSRSQNRYKKKPIIGYGCTITIGRMNHLKTYRQLNSY